ncbi:MAG: Ribose ABC transport system, permease protein RbsC, partial [uncultured Friedmanniella sp.]
EHHDRPRGARGGRPHPGWQHPGPLLQPQRRADRGPRADRPGDHRRHLRDHERQLPDHGQPDDDHEAGGLQRHRGPRHADGDPQRGHRPVRRLDRRSHGSRRGQPVPRARPPAQPGDHVPAGVGDRRPLGRGRHARGLRQRAADRQAQPGPVHRHARHALRGPRPHPGAAQRPEHHQRAQRPALPGQHRLLRRLRQPSAGAADLGLGDDHPRRGLLAAAHPHAVRPLALRHGEQRARRAAVRRPGQAGADPDLRDLRLLRRGGGHPADGQHQLLDGRPRPVLRAQRDRRGGHRRRGALRRPRHGPRHHHRCLRHRLPRQRPGHRRRLALLAAGHHRRGDHPRGGRRPDPADHPATTQRPSRRRERQGCQPGHDAPHGQSRL